MTSPDDLMHSLGRIESKVDSLSDYTRSTHRDVDKLEERTRKLEQFKAWAVGVAAAAGAASSYIIKKLGL